MRAVVVSLETIDFSIDSRRIKGKRGRGKESPGKARESSSTEIPRIRAFPRAAFFLDASPPYLSTTAFPSICISLSLSPRPSPFPLGQRTTAVDRKKGQWMLLAPSTRKKRPLADGQMTSSYFLCHFILFNDRVLKYRFQRKKRVCGDEWKENLKMFCFSCILPPQLRSSPRKRGSTTTKK